jgi:hypothetical protein
MASSPTRGPDCWSHSATICSGGTGGLDNGAREASFETKASEDSLAGMGGCRNVLGNGGGRVRGNRADRELTVATDDTASRDDSRRGGTLRHQLGDVLCVRQGKCQNTPARRTIRTKALRRLRPLRRSRPVRRSMRRRMRRSPLWWSMRRMRRSPPMRMRSRLRSRLQLQLLSVVVVGILQRLLGLSLLLLRRHDVVAARFEQVRRGQTHLTCTAARRLRAADLPMAAGPVASKSTGFELAGAWARRWRSAAGRRHESPEAGAANAGARVSA